MDEQRQVGYRRGNEPVTYDGLSAELAGLELRLSRTFAEAERLAAIERTLLSEAAVRELIGQALQASEARGWTNRERIMGLVLFAVSLTALVLQFVNTVTAA